MNMPRTLLTTAALLVSVSTVAGPQPQPQFSQQSRDALLARTPPLGGELVVAPALPAKRTARKSSSTISHPRKVATVQLAKSESKKPKISAAEAARRENCELMKQMYRSQVRDGGIVAVDSNGREFVLRGARADYAIAKAKRDVARWCD